MLYLIGGHPLRVLTHCEQNRPYSVNRRRSQRVSELVKEFGPRRYSLPNQRFTRNNSVYHQRARHVAQGFLGCVANIMVVARNAECQWRKTLNASHQFYGYGRADQLPYLRYLGRSDHPENRVPESFVASHPLVLEV